MEQWVNKVIEGDCLDVMEQFPAGSIDMVLADLPYGLTHNKWDAVIDLEALWRQYKRVVKPTGAILLTGQGLFTAKLILSNPAMFRYKMVWIKSKATNFLNAGKQPLRKHEDISVFYQKPPVYHPQMVQGKPYDRGRRKSVSDNYNVFKEAPIRNLSGKRHPLDVLFYEEEHSEDCIYFKTAETEDSTFHATQKPVALGRYLIRTYSNEGDIILDNTCGSGSFLVAAVLEGRQFIGIEKNKAGHKSNSGCGDLISRCRQRIDNAYYERGRLFNFENKDK